MRIAALDGENTDPANGLTLEDGLRAYSLWGEMAYRLAGRDGYERVRVWDETHTAPGAETIRELFGGEPTLILLDEVSGYLRKVEQVKPGAAKQFAAFVHDLFKAVVASGRWPRIRATPASDRHPRISGSVRKQQSIPVFGQLFPRRSLPANGGEALSR